MAARGISEPEVRLVFNDPTIFSQRSWAVSYSYIFEYIQYIYSVSYLASTHEHKILKQDLHIYLFRAKDDLKIAKHNLLLQQMRQARPYTVSQDLIPHTYTYNNISGGLLLGVGHETVPYVYGTTARQTVTSLYRQEVRGIL